MQILIPQYLSHTRFFNVLPNNMACCLFSIRFVILCLYRFQNVFLRYPTPRLHCSLSSHWPSFRFLSFMAFFIPSIQFFFGLLRALFCVGIYFNAILCNLPSVILWTWPYWGAQGRETPKRGSFSRIDGELRPDTPYHHHWPPRTWLSGNTGAPWTGFSTTQYKYTQQQSMHVI